MARGDREAGRWQVGVRRKSDPKEEEDDGDDEHLQLRGYSAFFSPAPAQPQVCGAARQTLREEGRDCGEVGEVGR